MNNFPVLQSVTVTPSAPKYAKYRWCDYIELRCLTHRDHRFSRDALAEAMTESEDVSTEEVDFDPDVIDLTGDEAMAVEGVDPEAWKSDQDESYSANYFKHLRWRSSTFGEYWPFVIDAHAKEIQLKPDLNTAHYFYLQLLLSSLLKYCPKTRFKTYTGAFEEISLDVFRGLMPQGAQVHSFGATHSTRYTGNLFDRLTKLAKDVRGSLRLTLQDFPKNDAGDGGLDLVAWHDLKDTRDYIPVALAQCGCTADDWSRKMLEASPATLGGNFSTGHPWATYYFMPLDLTDERDGQMQWQERRHVHSAIVIDRLRLIRLADFSALEQTPHLTKSAVDEALKMHLT